MAMSISSRELAEEKRTGSKTFISKKAMARKKRKLAEQRRAAAKKGAGKRV